MDNQVKTSLRIHVDREKNKVLFAEAENDFVDTLLSFLTLPMGTVIRILKKHSELQPGPTGCFENLYESVENLHTMYLWSEECKEMLLNPRNAAEEQCQQLKLNLDDTGCTKYFICQDWNCSRGSDAFLSTYNTLKCCCGKLMNRELGTKSKVNTNQDKGKGGVFVCERSSVIVTDDLHVLPNLPTLVFDLLNKCGYRELNAVEEINLEVGFKELLTLLNCSLQSKSPMTDTLLSKRLTVSSIVKSELRNSTETQMAEAISFTIKIAVQKSSNKVLFAEAEENFVDFLFSFLTIPLGGLARILSGDIEVGSIGNLYSSVSMLNTGEYNYLTSQEVKEMLVNPQLATLHLCKNQIFSLCEAEIPQYYCYSRLNNAQYTGYLTQRETYCIYPGPESQRCTPLSLKNPKIEDTYTRPAMFIVTDDLVVSPLSSFSAVSFLQKSNISLSDVEERVISIGLEEAREILKAAFGSGSALTKAFVTSPVLQECEDADDHAQELVHKGDGIAYDESSIVKQDDLNVSVTACCFSLIELMCLDCY